MFSKVISHKLFLVLVFSLLNYLEYVELKPVDDQTPPTNIPETTTSNGPRSSDQQYQPVLDSLGRPTGAQQPNPSSQQSSQPRSQRPRGSPYQRRPPPYDPRTGAYPQPGPAQYDPRTGAYSQPQPIAYDPRTGAYAQPPPQPYDPRTSSYGQSSPQTYGNYPVPQYEQQMPFVDPRQALLDNQLKQMVNYQYQLQYLKSLNQDRVLQNLPEMIRKQQANFIPGSMSEDQITKLNSMRQQQLGNNGTELNGTNSIPEMPGGLPGVLPGVLPGALPGAVDGAVAGVAGAVPEIPGLPINGVLKSLGNLLTSVLHSLTGVTGAVGVASNKGPNELFGLVENDLLGFAQIKGPKNEKLVTPALNPLKELLNSLGPVLNTVLGSLPPLGKLG